MIGSISSLVAFLRHFHRHWLGDPSLDPSIIPADLPDGLALIYRELGKLVEIEQGNENDWRAPFTTQDALMPLSRLKRIDGMVEFAWENQGNWSARAPIGKGDPPVYSNAADAWESVRRGHVVVCDSLNHFLTTLCLQEAVMSCKNLITVNSWQPSDGLIIPDLQPLWLHGSYVAEPLHQFYFSHDKETMVMEWASLWVGSPVFDVQSLVVKNLDSQVISPWPKS